MSGGHFDEVEQFEADLWRMADDLRANSGLASNEYFMPVMGLIFLRHAANRFYAAKAATEADQAAGKMPKRPLVEADFLKRRALMLPKEGRYDELLNLPKEADLGAAIVAAMNAGGEGRGRAQGVSACVAAGRERGVRGGGVK